MYNLAELQRLSAEIATLNARVINEKLAPAEREAARRKTVELARRIAAVAEKGDAPVFVINIERRRYILHRDWASYWITGREKESRYSSTVIAPAVVSKQGGPGWKRIGIVGQEYIRAADIAKDLCREVNGDLIDLGVSSTFTIRNDGEGPRLRKTLGLFVSDTAVPDEKLLHGEEEALKRYYLALVDEGDAIYARFKDRKFISNLAFEAAAYLGVSDREWTLNYLAQIVCQGCGQRIAKTAAQCPNCRWIINEELVLKQRELQKKLAVA